MPGWTPKYAHVDLEIGESAALLSVWPDIEIILCQFHLYQCWKKKANEYLIWKYFLNSKTCTGQFWLALRGSSFLDLSDVVLCKMVIDILRQLVQSTKEKGEQSAKKLSDYFENYLMPYYFDTESKRANCYHPRQWASKYNKEIQNERFLMTTNSCESMHAELRLITFYTVCYK